MEALDGREARRAVPRQRHLRRARRDDGARRDETVQPATCCLYQTKLQQTFERIFMNELVENTEKKRRALTCETLLHRQQE